MKIGFVLCIVLVPCFAVLSVIFGIFKEESAKLISGFNTLPKKEQDLYDKAFMARDMRNSFALWSVIMLIGAVCSYFISGYSAIIAYIIWGILFFKDVHLDAHKAFNKYLIK